MARHFYYAVGGDSRDDTDCVLPWAFAEARRRQAAAFIYLGDMELTPELDGNFDASALGDLPFYPVLGNHEVDQFGIFAVHWKLLKDLTVEHEEREFRKRFLGKLCTPVQSAFTNMVVYSMNLPGSVHFIALDNVSQRGFGGEHGDQHNWLVKDLQDAQTNHARHIVIGMHKALAHNGVTGHSMDEDCPEGPGDTAWALKLFKDAHVDLILASHEHMYAKFEQEGIPSYITGGLGAPLHDAAGPEKAFHHLLVLDVTDESPIDVQLVKFPEPPPPAECHKG